MKYTITIMVPISNIVSPSPYLNALLIFLPQTIVPTINTTNANIVHKIEKYHKALKVAVSKGAMFDARCFNIPKEEVANNLYWRQLDATRNSIQMIGQANFSHKELQHKNCSEIQDMLFTQKGINWNDFPTCLKRGSCCVRESYITDNDVAKTHWVIDKEIPIFKSEGRDYIEDLVFIGE